MVACWADVAKCYECQSPNNFDFFGSKYVPVWTEPDEYTRNGRHNLSFVVCDDHFASYCTAHCTMVSPELTTSGQKLKYYIIGNFPGAFNRDIKSSEWENLTGNIFSEYRNFSIWRVLYLANCPKLWCNHCLNWQNWFLMEFTDFVLTERFECTLVLNTSAVKGRWPMQRTHMQWHSTVADSSSTCCAHTPACHSDVFPG